MTVAAPGKGPVSTPVPRARGRRVVEVRKDVSVMADREAHTDDRSGEEYAPPEAYHDGGSPRAAVKGASSLVVLAGLWLAVSPWLLGYGDQAGSAVNSVLVGLLVAVLAAVRVARPRSSPLLSWANVLLGAWLIAAPFVLVADGLGGTAVYWNQAVVGVVVVVLATISAMASTERRTG